MLLVRKTKCGAVVVVTSSSIASTDEGPPICPTTTLTDIISDAVKLYRFPPVAKKQKLQQHRLTLSKQEICFQYLEVSGERIQQVCAITEE